MAKPAGDGGSFPRIMREKAPQKPAHLGKSHRPLLVPDVVVEVMSIITRREMQRKLGEYLSAGVRLIWYVYPEERVVDVYGGSQIARRLTTALMGTCCRSFTLKLAEQFAELD